MIAIYDATYIAIGFIVAAACMMKVNDLSPDHSLWYRYAYIVAGVGGGCMPFKFWYPQPFADWPALLVIVGAAMVFMRDKRRPPKEIRK